MRQETVGRWFGISQAQVSRVENGSPIVYLDRLVHWAQILQIPAHLLWFNLPDQDHGVALHRESVGSKITENSTSGAPAGCGSTTQESEIQAGAVLDHLEVLRKSVTEALSGSSFVSASLLEDWEQTILHHGEATRHRPASEQLPELATDFAEIQRLLTHRMASSACRRLTRVAAQMAGLMFLTLIKMGRSTDARRWIRTARIAVDEADDSATRSWVRGQEAYVHYYRGDLVTATAVASEAQAVAEGVPCAGVPLAAALQARAEAGLGHPQQARSALGRAEEGLSKLSPAARLNSAFGYNEAQLRFHEGNVYTRLRELPAARSAQKRALALYPPTDFLDRALVHLDQAACLSLDGDPDAAARTTVDTLLDLNETQRSGLIKAQAWNVYESLPAAERRRGAAADLRELLVGV